MWPNSARIALDAVRAQEALQRAAGARPNGTPEQA